MPELSDGTKLPDNIEYLGDGVYAYRDGFHAILITTDGLSVRNQIYLDDGVIASLRRWLDKTE